jgi:hypothetical protein
VNNSTTQDRIEDMIRREGIQEDWKTGGQEGKRPRIFGWTGPEDRRTGRLEDWRTGGQEDRRTGGQEDRKTGGLEDRRTGRQEDRRTGGQEDRKTGGLEDRRTGRLEDWRTGRLEDWRTGRQEDRKTGVEDRESGGIKKRNHKENPKTEWKLKITQQNSRSHKICIIKIKEGFRTYSNKRWTRKKKQKTKQKETRRDV